jgi:hypothetical protein
MAPKIAAAHARIYWQTALAVFFLHGDVFFLRYVKNSRLGWLGRLVL